MRDEPAFLNSTELDALQDFLKSALAVVGRARKRRCMAVSITKMKERGNRSGSKKIRNDDAIHRLRKRGLTIRAIAKIEGVSATVVQRSIAALDAKIGELK